MDTTRIIAVRHGETAWNADTRIQGQRDIPLNEKGQWQARRAAQVLVHADEPLAAIYSSDLARARDTARSIAQAYGLPVGTDPRFVAMLRSLVRERLDGDELGSHGALATYDRCPVGCCAPPARRPAPAGA